MGSDKGGYRLAMAFETEAGFQFVGHELEVGRLLERNELFEEGDDFRRPIRPMVATGKPGGEPGVFPEEAGDGAGKGGCGRSGVGRRHQ